MTSFKSMMKAINRRETVKMWAILNGKYSDFVQAYSSKDSQLRRYWENVIEPEAMRFSGAMWGENPRSPLHPVGAALYKLNGII